MCQCEEKREKLQQLWVRFNFSREKETSTKTRKHLVILVQRVLITGHTGTDRVID